MPKKINRRVATSIVLVVVGVALAMLVVAEIGNKYRFTQESVTIPGLSGDLAGVLTSPKKGQVRGLVVMVHGDGPMSATRDGLYNPWFEGAADAGYSTLSWSKPGVDGSEGDWLSQTMDDRAQEVSAAIDWAQRDGRALTQRVVLWGASQAGWVVPKVIRERRDIDAVVAVGPAINWLRQGRFNLDAELDHEGASEQERQKAIGEADQTRELLKRGVSYDTYRAETTDAEPMTEGRWSFVRANVTADAEVDLEASAVRRIPIHLMIGSQDRNVDVEETEEVYRRIFGPELSVTRVDGAHSLARPVMEDNAAVGWLTAVLWPRALLVPGVIDDYSNFLATIDQ